MDPAIDIPTVFGIPAVLYTDLAYGTWFRREIPGNLNREMARSPTRLIESWLVDLALYI